MVLPRRSYRPFTSWWKAHAEFAQTPDAQTSENFQIPPSQPLQRMPEGSHPGWGLAGTAESMRSPDDDGYQRAPPSTSW